MAAAASVLPGRVFGQSAGVSGNFDTAYAELQASLLDYLAGPGYAQVEPAPLVTDDFAFNGGLRYDAVGVPKAPGQMVVQSCARIDDISDKQRADVLPLFSIFHWVPLSGTTGDESFILLHQTMTESVGLDTARMGFVSIPEFEDLRGTVEGMGMTWSEQVFIRDPDEARAALDGSGYWQRPAPGDGPMIPSAGLYYWLGDGMPDRPLGYPASGNWIEIADVGFDSGVDLSASCGLERMVLAATGDYPTWDERLEELMKRIAASDREPPGKDLFEQS